MCGTVDVRVKYGGQELNLPLLIVKGEGRALVCWAEIGLKRIGTKFFGYRTLPLAALTDLLEKHRGSDLGTAKGFKAVESNASPRFLRARSVPYFYRDMVETELVLEGYPRASGTFGLGNPNCCSS